MPGQLPAGDLAPENGRLPESVRRGAEQRRFGVYVHVPYCRVRCGYCDFNTYTATELGGTRREDYAGQVSEELRIAAQVMQDAELPGRPVSTVFFGGGTPTLLPATDLVSMLTQIDSEWGLASDAEITTEANPDSVDRAYLQQLVDGGFTRVSFGMQSAVPHVLRTLDRTHTPERVPEVVAWAKDVGLSVSLDLIYGSPGESVGDWERSLDAALSCDPDHLSAYALIVERGTKLAAQIRRGEVQGIDEDLHAEMYELADEKLRSAGFSWYEISNWATSEQTRSRHNLAYWTGEDWWGAGPGSHSHIGGVRWWNVKHPGAYAQRLAARVSPAHAREVLSEDERHAERVLLESRIAEGLPTDALGPEERAAIPGLIADGLVEGTAAVRGRVIPTLQGRLLADTVVHRLLAS